MSLYEGAVKKPIMTSLCFLAVVIFGLFSLSKLPVDLVSGHRDEYHHGDDDLSGCQCFGYRK